MRWNFNVECILKKFGVEITMCLFHWPSSVEK